MYTLGTFNEADLESKFASKFSQEPKQEISIWFNKINKNKCRTDMKLSIKICPFNIHGSCLQRTDSSRKLSKIALYGFLVKWQSEFFSH